MNTKQTLSLIFAFAFGCFSVICAAIVMAQFIENLRANGGYLLALFTEPRQLLSIAVPALMTLFGGLAAAIFIGITWEIYEDSQIAVEDAESEAEDVSRRQNRKGGTAGMQWF